MPFTPFHMGPGLAVKAVGGRRFSLTVFGFSQIAIDIEPLLRMIRGDALLHGFTHTYLGATLVGLVSVTIGRPVCQFFLDRLRPDPGTSLLNWLCGEKRISWLSAIAGAFVGTYSHVFFDSIMHADMHPLAPLSRANGLLHIVTIENLHAVCVLSGLLGAALMIAVYLVRRGPRGESRG